MGNNAVLKLLIEPSIGDTLTADPKIPILTVKDNKGNAITLDNGFLDVTCDYTPQDVNIAKSTSMLNTLRQITASTVPANTGTIAGLLIPKTEPSDAEPKLEVDKSILLEDAQIGTPAPKEETPLNELLRNIKEVALKVKLSEGVPSPLIAACASGKEKDIIRDRR